ncbi:DUF2892 domain-containing protein [Haloarculaceae archaeon H-GB1-1]|nr:DUF2892 domain-containing protein [Haloarculaceae archaeon H-GB1-1]
MQQNVGNIDRLVRLVIGAPLLAVALGALAGFLSPPGGTAAAAVGLLLGAILVITALTTRCPLYSILGVSTCPID